MQLDTSDYHQRGAYFYGRLLDVPVQLCMLEALRPGDTVIDVGANIGVLTMLAAHAVGRRGHVISFEPNPEVYERLLWHLSENELKQVVPNRLALGDRNATLELKVPATGNTGAGTLGVLPPRHGGRVGAAYEVAVRVGDEVLRELPNAPLFVKLDIEGFETPAIRGLAETIRRHAPAILLESNVEMLPATGTSVAELFELLAGMEYEPFALVVSWRRWARDWHLSLLPMPTSWRPVRTQNVLFLNRSSPHLARLAKLCTRRSLQPSMR
jgi:FkbM family methyltransferase